MKEVRVRARRWWIGGLVLVPFALGFIPGVPHPFLNLFLWWVPVPPRVEPPDPIPDVERVLVVAPHPDDEVLALGGTIANMVREGQEVLIVFLTNGDANRAAKRLFTLNPLHRAVDYRALGYRRQKEAVRALSILGVPKSRLIFLGYPDGGLATMWASCWDREVPYTSPYTKARHPFYTNSYRPEAVYCGEDLMLDLTEIMGRFRPTVVYLPHPDDAHPDHQAALRFAVAALAALEWEERPELRLYLVHAPRWPFPRRLIPDLELAPPATFDGWQWQSCPLPEEVVELKLAAVRAYSSQRVTNGRFLAGFVRPNEIYTRLPGLSLAQLTDGAYGPNR
ncbi:PIG-L family deacetylase [Candidatus Bipolaricaulota bacterium]|nr:PIG-L family deacetylase [Candidatus Bipolaricaulota bacterium]